MATGVGATGVGATGVGVGEGVAARRNTPMPLGFLNNGAMFSP